MATASDLAAQLQRLHEQAAQCRRLAAQAAAATRGYATGQTAQFLDQAGRRCEAAHSNSRPRGVPPTDSSSSTGAVVVAVLTVVLGTRLQVLLENITAGLRSWRPRRQRLQGSLLFEPDEPVCRSAPALPPKAGYRTYDMHGDSSTVLAWDGQSEHHLGAPEFAASVREDPDWDGSPIRLLACDTSKGVEPFAQRLAVDLGVDVVAPKESA